MRFAQEILCGSGTAKENTSTKSSESTVEPDYKSIRNMLIAYPRDYNKTIVYNKTNIPTVFYSISGIIMFAGFIGGCIVAQQQNNYSYSSNFDFAVAIIVWASSFISGMVFVGFGKVIEVLIQIRNKL